MENLKEKHKIFITKVAEGVGYADSYLIALKITENKICGRKSAEVQGSRLANKFKDLIRKAGEKKIQDEIYISKNPILFNSLINLGVIKCLFHTVKLTEDGKHIAHAEINKEAWVAMPFIKELIGRNMLNKDLFESKIKNAQVNPLVATQVNLNLNK